MEKLNYLKFPCLLSRISFHMFQKVSPSLLCEVNTNARLTCLGVWLDTVTDTKESMPPAAAPPPGK